MLCAWSECDEVADRLDLTGIRTYADALAAVTRSMGSPADIGHQIHANTAESLYFRAVAIHAN